MLNVSLADEDAHSILADNALCHIGTDDPPNTTCVSPGHGGLICNLKPRRSESDAVGFREAVQKW